MRHQVLQEVAVRVAEGHGGEAPVEQVQATAGVGPGGETVPDEAEMVELRLVPKRTLSDLEHRGAGVFAWNDQAAAGEEVRQQLLTMPVDRSPVHGAVFCDAAANEPVPLSVPFLLPSALGFAIGFTSSATDPSELEPLLV